MDVERETVCLSHPYYAPPRRFFFQSSFPKSLPPSKKKRKKEQIHVKNKGKKMYLEQHMQRDNDKFVSPGNGIHYLS